MSEMSITPTKTDKRKNHKVKRHPKNGMEGIIQWAEFCMNNVLTPEKVPNYMDYLRWLEKLADQENYDLDIPVFENYKKKKIK